MKKIPLQLNPAMMNGLTDLLEHLFNVVEPTDDEDKLLFAVLSDFHLKQQQRLLRVQTKYTMQLTPAEAIALKLLQVNYVPDVTSYIGNKLHQVVQQVNKNYQSKHKPSLTT